jgi:L-fucose isomerase-like protein
MATRDWRELATAIALLKAVGQMRQSKLLLASAKAGPRAKDIRERFGPEVIDITTDQLIAAHKAVDEKLATETAHSLFIKPARKIVEPSRAEIVKSAKMYLAMKQLMAGAGAQAIAVNCLGGIPIQILGYPCLGFAQLCDEGFVGACEADLDSTLTMLLFAYAFGKPGFITDPLFDTSKNAVIHAHCVSPTRMDGPGGTRAPFNIRTHRDDNRGASLEVAMRVGQPITCAKFIDDEALLISTGKIIEGKPRQFDDRGCRTQITTAVHGDARKMMANWSADMKKYRDIRTLLHRVVFYGDHTAAVQQLASLMGFKVIPEC